MAFIKFQGNNESEKSEKSDMVEICEYQNEGRPVIVEYDGIGDFGLKFGVQMLQWCEVNKEGTITKKNKPTLQIVWNVANFKGKKWIDHNGKFFPWSGQFKGLDGAEVLAFVTKLYVKAAGNDIYQAMLKDWESKNGAPKVKPAQSTNPAVAWQDKLRASMGIKPPQSQIREPETTTTEIPDLEKPQAVKPVRRGAR